MSLAPANEESGLIEGKNFDKEKITSQLSARDVTSVVSLESNNQA
jgi:hypothetical protein